eukprot:gb/GECG01016692.1/.p1 GENE.gb/GECG01016692.1/~~gb/GECG01016692.1/.p1  ORF type:complete len:325 (+),score=53.28 gb/GECG01016692.1/:1-975(+)
MSSRIAPVVEPALENCDVRGKALDRRIQELEKTVGGLRGGSTARSPSQVGNDGQPEAQTNSLHGQEILCPLSKVGFLIGEIQAHPDKKQEVLVPFGEDTYAWCSMEKACEIFDHRISYMKKHHREVVECEHEALVTLNSQIHALTGVPACYALSNQAVGAASEKEEESGMRGSVVQSEDGTVNIQEFEHGTVESSASGTQLTSPSKAGKEISEKDWNHIQRMLDYYEWMERQETQAGPPDAEEKQVEQDNSSVASSATTSYTTREAITESNSPQTSSRRRNQNEAITDTVFERNPLPERNAPSSTQSSEIKPVSRFKQRLRKGG